MSLFIVLMNDNIASDEYTGRIRVSSKTARGRQLWGTELRFYVPPNTKLVISETFFPANLHGWHRKTKSNTTKTNIKQNEQKKNKTKARFDCLLRSLAWKWNAPINIVMPSCSIFVVG